VVSSATFEGGLHNPCRLFEPYVVQIIDSLLDRFGDGSTFVREANDQAAQTIMANLSNSGTPPPSFPF